MTESMIERVARAIWDSTRSKPGADNDAQFALDNSKKFGRGGLREGQWDYIARAAIEAMRDVPDTGFGNSVGVSGFNAKYAWQVMIDAILSDAALSQPPAEKG